MPLHTHISPHRPHWTAAPWAHLRWAHLHHGCLCLVAWALCGITLTLAGAAQAQPRQVHKCGSQHYSQWPCTDAAHASTLPPTAAPTAAARLQAEQTTLRLQRMGADLASDRQRADRLAPMAVGADAHTRPGAAPGAGMVRLPTPEEQQAMARREQREALRAQRRAQRHAERLAQARELAEVRAQARQAYSGRRARTVKVPPAPR